MRLSSKLNFSILFSAELKIYNYNTQKNSKSFPSTWSSLYKCFFNLILNIKKNIYIYCLLLKSYKGTQKWSWTHHNLNAINSRIFNSFEAIQIRTFFRNQKRIQRSDTHETDKVWRTARIDWSTFLKVLHPQYLIYEIFKNSIKHLT